MLDSIVRADRKEFQKLGLHLENILENQNRSTREYAHIPTTYSTKILLIEDFPIVREYLQKIFIDIGCSVFAVTEQKAISELTPDIDFIFFNIGSLSWEDSVRLLKAIKRKQSSYKRIPAPLIVSMLTSNNRDLNQCYLDVGADGIFGSPEGANKEELQHLLELWVPFTSLLQSKTNE